MDAARWTQVQTLFEAALERPPPKREAYLETACAGDPGLLHEVRSLLAADADAHPLLDGLALDAIGLPDDLLPTGIFSAGGERVGPYRIVEPLGRGGMGAVYLAERADGGFDQQVALKLIRGGLASGRILRRFESERQILARLQHPNIARLLDGGLSADGRPYFAMEHVDGVPLDRYCDRHDCPVEERVRLVRDACTAVQYAHRRLIVHRDLKPSNLLVTPGPAPDAAAQVKLLDFGIAKVLAGDAAAPEDGRQDGRRDGRRDGRQDGRQDGDAALTRTGHAVMTPAYAAPEQVKHAPVTTAADVYALGVVLYELLAGQRPFDLEGRSPAALERIVATEVPEPPSALAPSSRRRAVRGDLDTICLKALRKEPERRYASAGALADDLQRFLEGRPVTARPDTAGYRVGKFLRRHRSSVAAGVVVVGLVAALVGFYTARLTQERDRARLEAATAAQVSEFLQDLFVGADPGASGGEDLTVRQVLDRGAARIDRDLSEQPQVQARMMQVMGEAYQSLGVYDAAAPLLERSLALRRAGGEPRSVAAGLHSLAVFRQETGEYAAADSLYRAALALQRERRDRDASAATAAALHDWGTLLHRQGAFDRADSLLQRALALRTDRFGAEDPRTASTLNEQATLRFDRGDREGAASLYRRVLDLRRQAFAGDHPDVAASLNNLAMVLRHQGNFEAARARYEEALAMRRRLYDGPHPDVAHTLNHLGRLHANQGDYAAAEPYAREGLAMRIALFGEEHVEVSASLGNLAGILGGQGDHEGQARHYGRALEIVRTTLGDAHPYAAALTYSLGSAFHAGGDRSAAEARYRESLALHREIFPDGHANTAYPLIRLGALLVETGRAAEAEPLLREAVALRTDALGADHWRVAVARSTLGFCLAARGRPAEAEPLLAESYRTLRDAHGPDDRRVREARKRLADARKALP
jgi:serine/threonine-protein kinase